MGCLGCPGTCCTYEANSMMVTPVEAFELYNYLNETGQFNLELKKRLEETVAKFRLDHGVGNGRRSFLRRTYTCPFFNHKELGCPIPRDFKPYGCIAFNSHDVEKKAGEHCYSEINILEAREKNDPEEQSYNEELKKKYSLFWDKVPMPVALLDFFNVVGPK